jgi:hypothetical protein
MFVEGTHLWLTTKLIIAAIFWLQGDADSALDRLWAKKKAELGQ